MRRGGENAIRGKVGGNFDPTSGEADVNGLHPLVSQRGYAQNLWNGA